MDVNTKLNIIQPNSNAVAMGDFTYRFNFSINHEFNIPDDLMVRLDKLIKLPTADLCLESIIHAIFNKIYIGGYELIEKIRDSKKYSLRFVFIKEHFINDNDEYSDEYKRGVLQVFLSDVSYTFPYPNDQLLVETRVPNLFKDNISDIYDFIFCVFEMICSYEYSDIFDVTPSDI